MQTLGKLTIIGTSHISKHSVDQIQEAFHKINPDVIAVELDKNRLHALFSKETPSYSPRLILSIGVTGYLFALIGGILQKKLGDFVGMTPGSEMLTACNIARNNQKKIALIDRDVRATLTRLSQTFTFKHKVRLLFDIVRSPFSKKIRIDLTKVPEKKVIKDLLYLLKERYPGLYIPLIEERNQIMAEKLASIMANHPDYKILAVVGAGHEDEIIHIIKQLHSQGKYI